MTETRSDAEKGTVPCRHVVACPRSFEQTAQLARAFDEARWLHAYHTGFAVPPRLATAAARLARTCWLPRWAAGIERRTWPSLTAPVRVHPTIDVLRSVAAGLGSASAEDILWERDDWRFARAVARRLEDHIDVLHVYEHAALEALREARRRGIRGVLHTASVHPRFHERLFDLEYARHPHYKATLAWQLRERRARRDQRRLEEIREADAIVAWSSFAARTFIEEGVPESRLLILSPGMPEATSQPIMPTPEPGAPLRAMYAGQVAFHKGCHVLLEAWRGIDVESATLTLLGRVSMPVEEFDRPNITCEGAVSKAALLARMRSSDVLVLPTLCDSFGLVITEALSVGLPVLTTEHAGAADLLEEGVTGWIVPAGDAAALARRLEWCAAHRAELRAARRVRGPARVRTWADFRHDARTLWPCL